MLKTVTMVPQLWHRCINLDSGAIIYLEKLTWHRYHQYWYRCHHRYGSLNVICLWIKDSFTSAPGCRSFRLFLVGLDSWVIQIDSVSLPLRLPVRVNRFSHWFQPDPQSRAFSGTGCQMPWVFTVAVIPNLSKLLKNMTYKIGDIFFIMSYFWE